MVLDSLDDDDRVVDDEADGEDQAEEGERVDREPQEREGGERADQRDRDGDHGDQRRAPVLEEEKNDEDDEDDGGAEGLDDLPDPLGDRKRQVERDRVVEVGGKPLLQLRHRLLDAAGHGEGVRAGRLKDRNDAGGLAVQPADLLVGEAPELDPRNVLQAHDRAVRVGTDDDLAELLRRLEPPLRPHRIGQLLPLRGGLGADLAGGIHGALLLDGLVDVGHGYPEIGEQVRLDPDAHRVVAGAEDQDLADARNAVERVVDVDRGVVGQKERVVGVLRRIEGDQHQREPGRLPDVQAELTDVGGKEGLCLRQAVLRVDLVLVDVGVDVECHELLQRVVVGVDRLHVQHVVHAVHLLLDRRGDRLLDRHRVRSRVGSRDDDLRRNDVGELRHRKPPQRDEPRDDRHDRDDDSDDGPADEESGHE